MKIVFKAIAILAVTFGVSNVHAQIPVTDAMSIAQQIQQVAAWGQQFTQMKTQLETQKKQFESMSGSRGMASLANDPNARAYLPAEYKEMLKLMESNGGKYGGISGSIKDIRTSNGTDISQFSGLSGDGATGKLYKDQQQQNAMNRAVGEAGYKAASDRFASIQTLLDKVNQAPEQKDILDLQARIQVEQVMMQNEQAKLTMMSHLAAAQRDIQAQQRREAVMKAATGTIPRF